MTLIEHGELVRRALEYVQEERCRRPDAPLSSLQRCSRAHQGFRNTPPDFEPSIPALPTKWAICP